MPAPSCGKCYTTRADAPTPKTGSKGKCDLEQSAESTNHPYYKKHFGGALKPSPNVQEAKSQADTVKRDKAFRVSTGTSSLSSPSVLVPRAPSSRPWLCLAHQVWQSMRPQLANITGPGTGFGHDGTSQGIGLGGQRPWPTNKPNSGGPSEPAGPRILGHRVISVL